MDGIVRMRTIAFTPDRTPTLRRIRLGYEGDNLVERLEFDLPEIAAGQTATLMITGADAVTLNRTDEGRYAVDLTRDMIGPDGEREAYVRIDGAGGGVWQSAVMRMVTGALPDVEEEIERVYPTAVGQMLTAMAEHSSEMDAQEERVEQAAQRAEDAAKRAEVGGGSGSGGSAVEIDATLTQAGKAADAKATGDRLSELSKEGEYVLVESITVTEENTTAIDRTAEPDGTRYDFRAVIMQITFEAAADTTYFRADVNDNGSLSMTIFSAISTSKRYLYIRVYRENGYLFMEASTPSTSPYTATTNTFPGAQRFWKKDTGIRQLQITVPEVTIPVGSEIKIYGVRNNA